MKKGFTLLELIVSLGVFTIAVLISTSSLLALINAQKKAVAFQSSQENVRFALEVIARDLRTGDFYYCGADNADIPTFPTPKDCPSGGSNITFRNASGSLVTFQLENDRIQRSDDGAPFQPVTAQQVTIESFVFYVLGSSESDSTHPRITMVVSGTSGIQSARSDVHLQTTISQRKVQR